MGRYFRLWLACAKNCLARQMEFKLNFILAFVVELSFQFFNLAFFDIIFRHVDGLGDWTRGDIFVFMGSLYFFDGLLMILFFGNLIDLPGKINRGELDLYLLKPVSVQFLATMRFVRPENGMNLVMAVGIIGYGLHLSAWSFQLLPFLAYLFMLANSLAIVYSTFLAFQSLAFWLQASQGFEGGYFSFYNFMMKPDAVYRGSLRVVMTYLFPAIVISSVPARVLLGKEVPVDLLVWSLVCGVLSLAVGRAVFRRGLRRYESASS